MFCDICDSTAMSESLDAEDVREVVLVYQKFVGALPGAPNAAAPELVLLLTLLFPTSGEVLMSLGGHIAQYLGDGILTYVSLLCSLLSSLLCSLLSSCSPPCSAPCLCCPRSAPC